MIVKKACFIDSNGSLVSVGDYCRHVGRYIVGSVCRVASVDSDLGISLIDWRGCEFLIPWADRSLYVKVSL